MEYLICYDISNNKKRRLVYEYLKDQGLKPVQESVFWGDLIKIELNQVKKLISDNISKSDRVLIMTCNIQDLKKSILFNYNMDDFKIETYDII